MSKWWYSFVIFLDKLQDNSQQNLSNSSFDNNRSDNFNRGGNTNSYDLSNKFSNSNNQAAADNRPSTNDFRNNQNWRPNSPKQGFAGDKPGANKNDQVMQVLLLVAGHVFAPPGS